MPPLQGSRKAESAFQRGNSMYDGLDLTVVVFCRDSIIAFVRGSFSNSCFAKLRRRGAACGIIVMQRSSKPLL